MALPPVDEILFRTPLYKKLPIESVEDAKIVFTLEHTDLQFDAPCVECGRDSVFKTEEGHTVEFTSKPASYWLSEGISRIVLTCTRDDDHQMVFYFRTAGDGYMKIGQYPSLADLAAPELKTYRKTLGDHRHGELSMATRLASGGANIGACTYLRRVFESLLEDHRKAMEGAGTALPGYDRADVAGRVKMLAASLPPFLVKNVTLYGILSKGIHELDEEICGEFSRF